MKQANKPGTSMIDKVFPITINGISSLVADRDALKFLDGQYSTLPEFSAAWISEPARKKVAYDSIRSIQKDSNSPKVIIQYRSGNSVSAEHVFSFFDFRDCETFFDYMEREKHFNRSNKTLVSFNALRNHLLGLVAVVVFTTVAYTQAIKLANDTEFKSNTGKGMIFNYLIGLLGEKGVLIAGAIFAGLVLFLLWKRIAGLPRQIRLSPPKGARMGV